MKKPGAASPRKSGSGRLSAEEARKLPDRLLDAAAALFLSKGYAQATMEGIAQEAQASTKTVYSRYASKGEILAAVIRRLVERTLADWDTGATVHPATAKPRNVLRDIGVRFASLVTAPQTVGINRLVIAEASQFPDLVPAFAEGPDRAVSTVRSALLQWRTRPEFRHMPEPDVAAALFYDMATATPRMRALFGNPMSPAAIRTHVTAAVELFLRGCGGTGPR